MTTLQDKAQKEGRRVLNFLERPSQSVLRGQGFGVQGQPNEAAVVKVKAGTDRRLKAEDVEKSLTAVVQEMEKRGFSCTFGKRA